MKIKNMTKQEMISYISDKCLCYDCNRKKYKRLLCRDHYSRRFVHGETIGNAWNGPDD